MKVYSFEKLEAWVLAKDLTKQVYLLTKKFPNEEIYGLTSQIRRASISICSNIAEGSGRTSKIDFARFIQIAYGSMMELLNQLIIAEELEYIQKDELVKIREQIDQISIRLSGLRKSLLQSQL
ncbi:MAG: four helix bundle protein [Chitinophagales bacterium]|jgi:four helix bundle protein|nr:four helix bundle protein [Sphingobacteriales bacterium]